MNLYSVTSCLQGNAPVDTIIRVQGWVKTKRDSKAGISFIHVSDGSSHSPLQLVAPQSLPNYAEILTLTSGCAICAEGILVASQGKGQQFEMQVHTLRVVGWVENPETYPIQPKHHTMEFLRDVAHLRPRTNIISAVTRVRHCLSQAIHRFFHEQGFYWIHTPIITASDCEGAGDMFRVSTLDLLHLPKNEQGTIDFSQDFFGKETFLTVSGQLNVESYCLAMSKVYTFGPTFRAENSNTSRHLAEFWMIEPEIAFADLGDIMQLSETMLKTLLNTVMEEQAEDLTFFDAHIAPGTIAKLQHLIDASFETMTYTDAIAHLERATVSFQYPVHWGLDLQSEHERYLCENLCKRPVIITDYPKDIKGFYMRLNDDQRTVAAMDVLAPGIGEIIGGSQREERLHVLDQRMQDCHLNRDAYQWYRELRQYGSVPHAGFGLGLERLISYITGVSNVRDVIPFPRTPGNATF